MEVKAHNRNTGKAGLTNNIDQATKELGLPQPSPGVNRASGSPAVGVNVSGKAKDVASAHQMAFDIAKNTDPVRHDRVAELKAKIASGKYEISAENIANGMLREAIKDEVASLER